jgi:hypothetical protein
MPRIGAVIAITLAMIVVLAAIMPFLEAGGSSDRREMGQTTWSVIMDSMVRANVTVLGSSPDTQFIADSLEAGSQRVAVVSNADELDRSAGVLCVDCTGMSEERLLGIIEPMRALILTGMPVIFVNDTLGTRARVIEGQNLSYVGAVPENGSPILASALKHDPLGGRSGSLDLGGWAGDRAQLASALDHALDWSSDRLENAYPSGILRNDVHIYVAFSYSYFSGETYAPFGRYTISNTYIRTVWNSSYAMDQWSVHYRVESDPGYGIYGNDYRTGSMTLRSTFGEGVVLNRHYPGTAYGADSASIHFNPNEYDWLNHWEYEIRDVTVMDHSNSGTKLFSLDHMPDRGDVVSRSPYSIEPGAGMSVERNAGITFQESYGIDWQSPSIFAWKSNSAAMTIEGSVE